MDEKSIKEEKEPEEELLENVDIISKKLEIKKLKFEIREADKIQREEEEIIRKYMEEIKSIQDEIDEQKQRDERLLSSRNNQIKTEQIKLSKIKCYYSE